MDRIKGAGEFDRDIKDRIHRYAGIVDLKAYAFGGYILCHRPADTVVFARYVSDIRRGA
jgi:hypothetical protein